MAFTGPLEDRIAIRELMDTHAHGVMAKDAELWGSMWADDAFWALPEYPDLAGFHGKEAIVGGDQIKPRRECQARRPRGSHKDSAARQEVVILESHAREESALLAFDIANGTSVDTNAALGKALLPPVRYHIGTVGQQHNVLRPLRQQNCTLGHVIGFADERDGRPLVLVSVAFHAGMC